MSTTGIRRSARAIRAASGAAELTVASPAPRAEWRRVHAADREALISQSPMWTDAICAGGGWEDASRLYRFPSGLTAVVPLVRRRRERRLGLVLEAGMPASWNMGGIVLDRLASPAETDAILAELASRRAAQIRIRPNPLQESLWHGRAPRAQRITRRAHVIDLDGGEEAVWARFRSQSRRGVRKATRSGVEIEVDTTGRLIPVFLGLQAIAVERWATQQNEPLLLARWRARRRDTLASLSRMAAHLGEACRVWVARHEGRPVAGAIVLVGQNASDTKAAMDHTVAPQLRANDLLQWSALQDAIAAGCHRYHMGESGSNQGLATYKERFGAYPVDYGEYRFERLPITRADRLARDAVKRLIGFRDA